MKKIYFILKSKETNIEEYVNSFIDNDNIIFKSKNSTYTFNQKANTLERKNDDVISKININKKIIEINLINNNYSLNIPITILKIESNEKIFKVEYEIDKDNIVYIEIRL